MRDREKIDAELRLIASTRQSISEQEGQPSTQQVDELLDERLGHRTEASEIQAPNAYETDGIPPRGRYALTRHSGNALTRYSGPLAAVVLSLIAVGSVLVVMLPVQHPDSTARPVVAPVVVPPSRAHPNPAPPTPPTPPKPPAPLPNIADTAFVDALTREGVPVPSHEYVTTQGHAVCDFLAHQSDIGEAVRYVQQSSIWDANQSADVAAGAIVSYCPQFESASQDQVQQTNQKALSDMQAIERSLQGIGDGLHGIDNGLRGIGDGLQGIGDGLQSLPGQQ
jgi:hypothetical protein